VLGPLGVGGEGECVAVAEGQVLGVTAQCQPLLPDQLRIVVSLTDVEQGWLDWAPGQLKSRPVAELIKPVCSELAKLRSSLMPVDGVRRKAVRQLDS
jgi:hypothetical protein